MNSLRPSRQSSQRTAFGLLGLATIVDIVAVSFIIIYIITNGAGAVDWAFLTQSPTEAGKAGGIFPALVGTFFLMLGTVLFSLPIGVSAGIYLAEYARDNRLTRIINMAILNLAGGEGVFHTAALMGSALFFGAGPAGEIVPGPGPVIAYNGVHMVVSLLIGLGAGWLVFQAEKNRPLWYIVFFIFLSS